MNETEKRIEQCIFDYVESNPGKTRAEITQGTGFKEHIAEKYLCKLTKEKRLWCIGGGYGSPSTYEIAGRVAQL